MAIQLKLIEMTFHGTEIVPCVERADGRNSFNALSTGMRMLIEYYDISNRCYATTAKEATIRQPLPKNHMGHMERHVLTRRLLPLIYLSAGEGEKMWKW
jgi:hypothetical protein